MNDLIDVIMLKYQELRGQGFFNENKIKKSKSLDEFQNKYNKSFIDKFSVDEIKKRSGLNLLEFLFQPMSDIDIGLSVAMERFMKEFGSFTGTDYDKSPVSYSKAKVDEEFPNEAWRIYEGKKISEEKAIEIAENTKETLLELYNYLLNEDFDSFYEKMPNDRYYRFYHKYFYIFFPKYLTSFHSKDFAPNLKEKLNLHLYNKLELEKFFYESFTKFNSTINCDDLRLTIEEIWGKGIKASEYWKLKKNKSMLEPNLSILSVDDWINILNDKSITTEDRLRVLYSLKDFGGSATCTQLSKKFGFEKNYYNVNSSSYGIAISKKYDLNVNSDYWTILYLGELAPNDIDGYFVWTLRSELNEALNRIDMSNISLYKNEDNNKENEMIQQPKNQILYGPPGTGKTYNTVVEAMKIIEPENFDEDGELKGEYKDLKEKFYEYKKQGRIEFVTFHQSYSYEEFVEGIKPVLNTETIQYEMKNGIFKEMCIRANANPDKKYVLIIDEINRGNISKIFGELITLIEEDKRIIPNGENDVDEEDLVINDSSYDENSLVVNLPYSQKPFGVPNNLYIIGTMNTSDRSIASVDIALRRRFKFKEMMPQTDLVADFSCNFKEVFELLNKRISVLLDRDHKIGHSYFIKDKYENAGVKELKDIWFDSILPLLNEYFYGDWEKLQKLLGCAKEKDDDTAFIKKLDIVKFADETTLDDEQNCFDFTDKEGIDFEAAMKHAFKDVFKIEEKNG